MRERLLFYEWSLSSLKRDGFQILKLKKRWGWILNHFPLKCGAILWRGLGDSLSSFLTHALYICVCEIIVLWMVIVLTWQGRLSELKIEKEMRMDSKSFPTKVGRNNMEGFGRFPFPISYACTIYVCVCVCVCVRERERERERLLFYEWSLSSLDRDGF